MIAKEEIEKEAEKLVQSLVERESERALIT